MRDSGENRQLTALAIVAGIATAVSCATTPQPPEPEAPVARFALGSISCAEFDDYIAQSRRNRRAPLDDGARRSRLEELVVETALAEAAAAAGVPELDVVRRRWEATRSSILVNAVEQDLRTAVIIDAGAARRYYDEHPERFSSPERVSTRLILIRLEPNAGSSEVAAAESRLRRIRQDYLDGEPFGALAREHSEAENAARGGAVAASPRGTLLSAFEKVAWGLEPGQVSDVVYLPDGLALILVERRFPPRNWSFDEVRERINNRLVQEELERSRGSILADAASRWPLTIDREQAADPETTDGEPIFLIGGVSYSLLDLDLTHRPPRLEEAVRSAVEAEWMRLWAEDHGYQNRPEVAAILEDRRRTLLAGVELDRRITATLPEVPEAELRSLYDSLTAQLAEPELRSFLAVVVPGEANKMRRALASAERVEEAWRRTGAPGMVWRLEGWGPISQSELSSATSPLLARTAFALDNQELSAPILFERYGMGSARFHPEGYVVLGVEHVTPARIPPLSEVEDQLTRRIQVDQVAALRRRIKAEFLDDLGFEIDIEALAGCPPAR